MQNFYCILDPVKCQMEINLPKENVVQLKKAGHPPSVLFHSGCLYYTVRNSQTLELKTDESRPISLWLQADCEITSDLDDSDSPSSSQSLTNSRTEIFNKMPFRTESGSPTACVRRVSLKIPDTWRENYVTVSKASEKAPPRRDAVPQTRPTCSANGMRGAFARGWKRKKIGTRERDEREERDTPRGREKSPCCLGLTRMDLSLLITYPFNSSHLDSRGHLVQQ